jgi:hypothetical protein
MQFYRQTTKTFMTGRVMMRPVFGGLMTKVTILVTIVKATVMVRIVATIFENC